MSINKFFQKEDYQMLKSFKMIVYIIVFVQYKLLLSIKMYNFFLIFYYKKLVQIQYLVLIN